jgi:hypothetical protein
MNCSQDERHLEIPSMRHQDEKTVVETSKMSSPLLKVRSTAGLDFAAPSHLDLSGLRSIESDGRNLDKNT